MDGIPSPNHPVKDLGHIFLVRIFINHLLNFTKSKKRSDNLWGLVEIRSNRIKYNVVWRDTDNLGTNIPRDKLTVFHFSVVCFVINSGKAVTVVDIVQDKLRHGDLKVRLLDLVLHISLNGLTLYLVIAVLVITCPLHPSVLGEQSCHIVGMEIVSDLSQLGDSGRVLPRQRTIACLSGISSKEVVSEFFPLFKLTDSLLIPETPSIRNFCSDIIWTDNKAHVYGITSH